MVKLVERKRRRKATVKQIKALQLINQGLPVATALRQAGYSRGVARKSTAFFKSPTVQKTIMSMKKHLEDEGLTSIYMAKKFKEWVDATKIDHSHTEPDKVVPDYDTQLRGAKLYFDRIDKIDGQSDPKVKRKLTIEEFVGEEDSPSA